ncbi:hypothetical protein OPV22_024943 [Ensete ventricosum]|uniref:Uncharacterized protein n=1 Tax=Ensete ventricosum TaxID=4639 RepID=A0AAV8QGA0_ENSVE|nr:hypothetical protein OPV22_024943 [Ensete ventricosum]
MWKNPHRSAQVRGREKIACVGHVKSLVEDKVSSDSAVVQLSVAAMDVNTVGNNTPVYGHLLLQSEGLVMDYLLRPMLIPSKIAVWWSQEIRKQQSPLCRLLREEDEMVWASGRRPISLFRLGRS